MELTKYLQVMLRWYWLIALVTVITGVAAYAVMRSDSPRYRSTASIWVTSSALPGVYTSASDLETFAQTYAQLISSTPVVRQALDSIGDGSSADAVLSQVSTRPIPRTSIFEVTVTDGNPARAQKLVNAITQTFVDSSSSSATKLVIASPATDPIATTDRRLGMLPAMALGFILATTLSFALDYLDNRVRTPSALEDKLGIRFLGSIPRQRRKISKGSPQGVSDPGSDLADAYRRLRPGILRALRRQPTSVLLASASASVDRGVVLLNVATALGEGGVRVIVVDADIRQPWLSPTLGTPERAGLIDLIERSNISVKDVVRPLGIPGVSVLPVGKVAISSSATLSSLRTAEVIRDIQQHADIVLYGCAPIAARSDAGTLAPFVGQAILLVEAGRERPDVILSGVCELERAGAIIDGAILLNVAKSDLRSVPSDGRSLDVEFVPVLPPSTTNSLGNYHSLGNEHRTTDASVAQVNHQ